MLTNETFLLESAHQTSSKLINKAPKCTIESFQLLLGAIDFINDNGGQEETFPKLLIYDDTNNHHQTTTTITEELSNSNSIEEDYVPPSLTISDESEDKSSEDESSSPTTQTTITTPKSKSNNSKHSNNSSNTNGKARGGHYRNGVDDSSLICSCCKRDSSAVSFLKNYSIHAGNIDNYRNTFPDYDVVPGISCMTCYHKSWRYSKGLYDPNKARGTVNKREGIQKSPSPSSSSSSTRKKSQKRKSNSNAVVEQQQLDNDVNSSEDIKSKPRKISKRRQNSSPSSNQSANDNSNQNDLVFENQMNENQSYTTSTYENNTQGTLHHSLRLVLKFVWIEQGDDGEVYSCPMSLDFVPTTLTSIKSLVIGKLKTKLSGYECDSIVWCHDNQKTLLTDTELQQKALRNDDILIVNVK